MDNPNVILRNVGGTEIASSTTNPSGTELGLIVRNIPSGTQSVTSPDLTTSGSISGTQTVEISLHGISNFRTMLSGTWSGTVNFEGTVDGVNWVPVSGIPVPALIGGSYAHTTSIHNGAFEHRGAGLQKFRVRGNSVTGTANVSITASRGTDLVATYGVGIADCNNTGTITNTQTVEVTTQGAGNARLRVGGVWTGTVIFEGTVDGTNWDGVYGVPSPVITNGGTPVLSTDSNGTWELRVAGLQKLRVRGSTVTSGGATIWIEASQATSYLTNAQVATISVVAGNNTYFAPPSAVLGAGQSFTGEGFDTFGYAHVSMSVSSDVPSANNGVEFQWSPDGVNWSTRGATTLSAARTGTNQATDLSQRLHDRWFRIKYTNGPTPQTWFKLQVMMHVYTTEADTKGVDQPPATGDDALLTKSVLTGKLRKSQDGEGTVYRDVSVDASGAINVAQAGNAGAFGSMLIAAEEVKINLSFPYAINSRLVNTSSANGGTIAWDTGRAKLSTGTNPAGSATLESRAAIQYIPGQGVMVRFTGVFTSGVANSIQEIGIGDVNDGFFFGYNGTSFGVCKRRAGVDTWIPQTNWNGDDKFDGTGDSGHTLDPTKGYPYQIQYQWLGFGAIKYFIENPKTGQFVLVHTIRYAGTETVTSINNPTLPLHIAVKNTGNTSDVVTYTPSMGALTEGTQDNPGSSVRFSFNAAVLTAPTTGKQVFSIRNKATNIFGGTNVNRQPIHLDHISIRAASAKDLYVTLYRNATIGTPTWTDISTATSIAQSDTTGTADGTGGIPLITWTLAGGTTASEDLTGYNLVLRPGEIYTFVMFAETSTVDGRVAISWHEEQ